MIVCTGKHTKQIDRLQATEKGYEVVFCLGATTPTYNAELPPENPCATDHLTAEAVAAALLPFCGEIQQVPPIYSALKIGGKRAYELARKGQEVVMQPRPVSVYAFTLVSFVSPQEVHAVVRCSKGTYIRSLVHDVGQLLGVGAYMTGLRRTQIGDYSLSEAWEIADFAAWIAEEKKKI